MAVPAHPKIYHILHADRLASVLADGSLFCDARMNGRTNCGSTIGMSDIKQRRLALSVDCHTGFHVGDCVPFYFCPRSVMLYLLHRGNHPNLTYRGGQEQIIHVEADLGAVVDWAERNGLRWAFTLSNAGSGYFESRCNLAELGQVNWAAVANRDFRDPAVQGRQAGGVSGGGSIPVGTGRTHRRAFPDSSAESRGYAGRKGTPSADRDQA